MCCRVESNTIYMDSSHICEVANPGSQRIELLFPVEKRKNKL